MKSIDISGMGGHYERCCQAMLIAGVEWLKEHPEFTFKGFESYKEIMGSIKVPDTPLAKELLAAINKAVQGDSTVVQLQYILGHLNYIHTHGYDAWLKEAESQGMTVVEVDPDEIVKQLAVDRVEWDLKIARGWDPLEEMLKGVPEDHIIRIDSSDPESVKRAMEKFGQQIKKDLEDKEKEE